MKVIASISNIKVGLTGHWSQPVATMATVFTLAKLASSYIENIPIFSPPNIALVMITAATCGYAIKASKVFAKTITKNSEVPILSKIEYEKALALQKTWDNKRPGQTHKVSWDNR